MEEEKNPEKRCKVGVVFRGRGGGRELKRAAVSFGIEKEKKKERAPARFRSCPYEGEKLGGIPLASSIR